MRVQEKGILITLVRSKASQDAAVEIAIPRADRPEAIEALERWIERAQIEPKTPLLRSVNNRGVVSEGRLTPHSVARVCKSAVRKIARARGLTVDAAQAAARKTSGHSLRAGLVSSAAAANVPALKIAQLSRHASLEMVMVYVRQASSSPSPRTRASGLLGEVCPRPATDDVRDGAPDLASGIEALLAERERGGLPRGDET